MDSIFGDVAEFIDIIMAISFKMNAENGLVVKVICPGQHCALLI